ncbi:hypothetical protein OYE22_32990 [Streptomyces sp. 71268]|uniref:hypothetical protein n=1 Tax=Streptomyces sp. 71268 TaxID=3002640 RepID=UPI0023F6C693|nr:hypothetical protein [Streptomyces sp. 71268]WEV29474.1 hypothetical protein OYE22_32990 [Streptomyces sp. 71268]
MDRRALREALRAARVSDDHYWIEGVHEPVPTPVDHLFLRGDEQGGWRVGAYERGTSEVIAVHGDEATACAHLWALLT